MRFKSKKYYFQKKLIGINKEYSLIHSLELLKHINLDYPTVKYNFDQSIDLTISFSNSILTKINPSKFKIYTTLPYSIGKNISIAILCPTPLIANFLNMPFNIKLYTINELIEKLEKKIIDFDILYTSKEFLKILVKYKKILESKGVMPSETLKTVIEPNNFESFISTLTPHTNKYSMNKSGILNIQVGKISFPIEHIHINTMHIINLIKSDEIIGNYAKNLTISSTMSPSIKLNLSNL